MIMGSGAAVMEQIKLRDIYHDHATTRKHRASKAHTSQRYVKTYTELIHILTCEGNLNTRNELLLNSTTVLLTATSERKEVSRI